jgi:hypothetical protein
MLVDRPRKSNEAPAIRGDSAAVPPDFHGKNQRNRRPVWSQAAHDSLALCPHQPSPITGSTPRT